MAHASYWTCRECGEVFPVSDIRMVKRETCHYWFDGQPIETSYEAYCPICGSEDIEPAEYCDNCGEPCSQNELVDGLCAVCREKK